MKDIFLTSTLHHPWNVDFNPKLCQALESKGFSCYFPERDTNQKGKAEEIFNQNTNGIKNAKKILVVAMNESPNWGAEVGFAFSLRKEVIGLTSKEHEIPIMASGLISKTLRVESLDNFENYLEDLISVLKE
ncbi:MAG: nucleoside 2-deoxyribosyltransferase [Patescibacteria group bacterium]|nr:nucleoside 2-deoxyribosyltransferase [Patescibacteria group bacterium]